MFDRIRFIDLSETRRKRMMRQFTGILKLSNEKRRIQLLICFVLFMLSDNKIRSIYRRVE